MPLPWIPALAFLVGVMSLTGARADDCDFHRQNFEDAKAQCQRSGDCQYVEALAQIVRESCRATAGAPKRPPRPDAVEGRKPTTDVSGIDQIVHGCIRPITDKNGSRAINKCPFAINLRYCGMDAGIGEKVAVCGRDIGGMLLKNEGDSGALTQGTSNTEYRFIACKAPYTPKQTRWNPESRNLEATGCRR